MCFKKGVCFVYIHENTPIHNMAMIEHKLTWSSVSSSLSSTYALHLSFVEGSRKIVWSLFSKNNISLGGTTFATLMPLSMSCRLEYRYIVYSALSYTGNISAWSSTGKISACRLQERFQHGRPRERFQHCRLREICHSHLTPKSIEGCDLCESYGETSYVFPKNTILVALFLFVSVPTMHKKKKWTPCSA